MRRLILLAVCLCLTLSATGRAQVKVSGNVGFTDGTYIAVVDPCKGQTKVYTAISQATSAVILTGTSLKKQYICSIVLVGADAENISIVSGTGTVCATNTGAVIGGVTAATGPNLAANGGFGFGTGDSSIASTTAVTHDLCLFQSGSGRIAGVMTSVAQ